MKKPIRLISWAVFSLSLAVLIVTPVRAQVESPIKITLTPSQENYDPDEPIRIQIVVNNTSEAYDIITREGFQSQDFHLKVTFTDPDGLPIRTLDQGAVDEPLAPLTFQGRPATPAEIIPEAWEGIWVMDDARLYYDFSEGKLGRYTAQVFVTFETFASAFIDPDSESLLAFLDDSLDVCNPIPTDEVGFNIVSSEPVVSSSIHAKVSLLKIGYGTSPKIVREPLQGAKVYLYRTSVIPPEFKPLSFKNYQTLLDNFHEIAVNTETDQYGIAKFDGIFRSEYLILVSYNKPFFPKMASIVSEGDRNWLTEEPIEKRLMVMDRAVGRKVSTKTTKLEGSELLIIEPEYVEWGSNAETYPFVFESLGSWNVETFLVPPPGFVADHPSLSESVSSELKALQFTVTEVGGTWRPTKIKYRVKRRKKVQEIYSEIGVKLTRKLAEEKGVGIYGEDDQGEDGDDQGDGGDDQGGGGGKGKGKKK
jgi:hypothetical protein